MIALTLLALGGGLPDLSSIAPDLEVPAVTDEEPAPGRRVRRRLEGFGELAHVLYLPGDWSSDRRLPVLVELPGNGGYRGRFGDVCDGSVEGAVLGYGLTGGEGFVQLALPFVDAHGRAARTWWGDLDATERYWRAALDDATVSFGADPARVVLAGFSRGAIGCNFVGLREGLADRWCASFCHSHYDGVREGWPYAGAGRPDAARRLARLGDPPQWISHEGAVDQARAYLLARLPTADLTFGVLPFRNHTDRWVLRDVPLRRRARRWLARVTTPPGSGSEGPAGGR